MNSCYKGDIHSVLLKDRFNTGRRKRDGPVVMNIIGNTAFLKLPFFSHATYVSLGITLPSHLRCLIESVNA